MFRRTLVFFFYGVLWNNPRSWQAAPDVISKAGEAEEVFFNHGCIHHYHVDGATMGRCIDRPMDLGSKGIMF